MVYGKNAVIVWINLKFTVNDIKKNPDCIALFNEMLYNLVYIL